MVLSLADLSRICDASVVGGVNDCRISGANSLAQAGPDDVAHYTDRRYAAQLRETKAAAVLVHADWSDIEAPASTALIRCADPEMNFLKILTQLYPQEQEPPGIHPTAIVEDSLLDPSVSLGPHVVIRKGATLGAHTAVLAGTYIGRNVSIGNGCTIHPNVTIYDHVTIGERCLIHSGAVIGADGFGYKFRNGRHVKVPQVGTVRIGNDVEIGANATIDRAALGETVIGHGCKIDNMAAIAHNVRLGNHVIVCGQVGIAGSNVVDDYAVFGAQSGVADHLHIGMGARIGAKSGVHKDVPARAEVFGMPADERHASWRQFAAVRKLPDLIDRVRKLERLIETWNEERSSKSSG